MDASEYIKLGIQLVVFIGLCYGAWYALKYRVEKIGDGLKNLQEDFDGYEELTPVLLNKLETLKSDVEKIKTEENMEKQYQAEIVKSILGPTLKEMSTELKQYVDAKTGVLTKEIELFKVENLSLIHI